MTTTLATRVLECEVVDGEVVGFVRVLALRNPFTMEREERRVVEGQTLAEILRDLKLEDWKGALISIDGAAVPPGLWARVRPRAGHLVAIRAVPTGTSGGGGGNKGWISAAIGVVLIVVGILLSVFTAGLGAVIGAGLVVMGIGLVISGALALIFPPPSLPKLKSGSGGDQPVFSITGSRNIANPYGSVTRVCGQHKIFPLFGALPFTEIVGNDQYLRELFILGYGPLSLSDFKIGETPLEQFTEVELEIRYGYPDDTPMKLFPGDVFEDPLSIGLSIQRPVGHPAFEPEPTRRTHGLVDEWSVDFVFGSGLYSIDGKGQVITTSTRIQISYRKVGAVDWIVASDKTYSGATVQPLRRSFRQIVDDRAEYEIKMHQVRGSVGSTGLGANITGATWGVLRSVLYQDPINLGGLCKVALRIKATDQLNGVVDQFNCIATSVLPDYDVATDSWIERPTRNPASIYRDILQGSANARPLPDARLDLPALQAWHTACAEAGRTFNFVVEQPTTVSELLRQVVAVGRASLGSIDGTFGVVRDIPQTVPVQHFTPRNSKAFSGQKLFRDLPHALKVRFINPLTNWEIDERYVYDDGYDETNASKFEAIQFFGVTDADQAWKEGRYHIACAKLRPEVYTFETDIEHLVCTRGDLIKLTHDVPLFGIRFGRLVSATVDGGGNGVALIVDDPVPMVTDGTRYSVRVRRANAPSLVAEVIAVEGPQTTLLLVDPLAPADVPEPDDLFQFGTIAAESVDVIVTRVEMLRDMGARITCVDAAPGVHQAETGPIPPHDPHITTGPGVGSFLPTPVVDAIRSDESVLIRASDGSLESRIVVFLHFSSGRSIQVESIDVRFRKVGTGDDWQPLLFGGDATQVAVAPVEDGATYDIMLRSVSPSRGLSSEWTSIEDYVVIGKSTPPPDVTTFLMEGLTRLRWNYPNAPADLAGFLLRRSRGDFFDWNRAQPIHDGILGESTYDLGVPDVGQVSYLVKAVDVAGNESLLPAVIVANLGDPVVANILSTVDKKAGGFPGTLTGCSIVGGNLDAENTSTFWVDDLRRVWLDDAVTYWTQQYSEMSYITNTLPGAGDVPCTLILDLDVTGRDWSLWYRSAGTTLFWSGVDATAYWTGDLNPVWGPSSDFLPWPGQLPNATHQVYEFLFHAGAGTILTEITKYLVLLEVPDLVEALNDVVIAATTGTRLPIASTYRSISGVSLTLEDDGGTAVSVKFFDKNPSTGPLVKCFNAAGAVVAGLVDAQVHGY